MASMLEGKSEYEMVIGLGMVLFTVGFPIWTNRFFKKNFGTLDGKEQRGKYDSLYLNIKIDPSYYYCYLQTVLFLVRRFALAIILIIP